MKTILARQCIEFITIHLGKEMRVLQLKTP